MNKIFISYSHKDEAWKDRLVTHLRVLQGQGLLEIWDDRRILAGDDWFPEIETALNSVNLAVLLISPDFLSSQFILEKEVPLLLDRRQKDGVRIIPVILKPCAWDKVDWLRSIQARPKDGRPLSGGTEHQIDTDLSALANELAQLLRPTLHAPRSTLFTPLPPDKITLAKLPTTSSALFGREKELKILDEAWADPHTNILTLVAWGGVGKTALVNEWLNQMQQQNYRGAERVYGWSFYSQGTREDRQASGDEFLAHSLAWFGDLDPNAGGPWDKGVRLAGLIRRQRTLLILDGLEPLQYPPGAMHGHLKDRGVQALLKELSNANPGLCIVTTREWVEDLSHKIRSSVKRVDLEHLSPEAGAALLRNWKVKGTEAELVEASNEFKGHALALNLLGSYLATVHDGEIRKRDLIPQLAEDEERGGHARRVMESYERWLAGTPELGILYLMGLFDRPAPKGAIDALLVPPSIAGLTSHLQLADLPLAKLQFALHRLRDLHLLAEKDELRPDTLDCHPLVREHFGEKLRQQNPSAWKEAHSRLYEYFKKLPVKELPDTLEEMEPLFAAVAHGCYAERHQEVRQEVYWQRIHRQNYYCVNKLGAFGADLATLSSLFEIPWKQPAPELTDYEKALVLNWAGFLLRATGRLYEAAQPIKAGMEFQANQQDWKNAAIGAGNLSELYLTMGEIKSAVEYARQSVEFADRSGDWAQPFTKRASLANALHQAGELTEAENLFVESETIQKHVQEYPYLYSIMGFEFCDLLLSLGRYQEVQNRATQNLKVISNSADAPLLTVIADYLSFGNASVMQVQKEGTNDFVQARNYLHHAVQGLREAGVQDYLFRGLLSRSTLYRMQGEFAPAWADLEEAREIAERGEMKLFLADYHLEACRVCLAEGKMEAGGGKQEAAEKKKREAEEHLRVASGMIEEMGYGRRRPEVEELRKQLQSAKA